MKSLLPACIISLGLLLAGWTAWAGDAGAPSANIYRSSSQLPPDLRRVVTLPLACDQFAGTMADGCRMLDPVLNAALVKTGRFEVVNATPEDLRRCTGKLNWTGDEVLPADFFDGLRNVYGCDAVLFSQLTEFRPSAPLAVGWRLKLVDAKTGKILWAADEIFDASNLDVATSAQQFEKREQPHHGFVFGVYSFLAWCVNTPTRSALDDQWKILHSPRYFGQFSAEQIVQTLPQR
jgi:hypothetical protein